MKPTTYYHRPAILAPALTVAARHYGTLSDLILSGERDAHTTLARHAVAWMLRDAGLSYPHIGSLLGVHHTTVLNAVRRVEESPHRLAAAKRLAESVRANRLHRSA